MPSLFERIKVGLKAAKDLSFPQVGYSTIPIFSDMNAWQNAITRTLEGENPANSSLVFSGIRWLGNRLPEAEIEVREPDPQEESDLEDETRAIPDHSMVSLWNWANRRQTGSVLMKAFAYSWILSGNVYFVKFRNGPRPVELWYEPHWNVTPRWMNDAQGGYLPISETQSTWIHPDNEGDDPKAFINYYEINRGNYRARVEPQDVLHFQDGIDPANPRQGLSGLQTLLREITGDSAIADYYSGLLGTGGMPSYGVSIDKDLQVSQEQVVELSDRLKRLPVGMPAVITGATFQQLGFSPKEMDNRVARYFSEERFAAVTGIPLECLNLGAAGEHSTYNNVTEANRQGTQEVVVPLWGHIGDTLTRQLLNDFDQVEERYVDFDITHVKSLQESEDIKAARVREDFEAGLITRGEARTARGYKENEATDKVYLVNGELVPADYVTPDPSEEPEAPAFPAPTQSQLALVKKALDTAPKTVRDLYEAKKA